MSIFGRLSVYGLFMALATVFVSPASAALYYYQLGDHPDGGATPPFEYGLRLSGLASDVYLTFDTSNGSNVLMSYDDSNGSVQIFGAAVQSTGQDGMGNQTYGDIWSISYSLFGVVDETNGFFKATGASGSITNLATNEVISLVGKQKDGYAFYFLDDRHRLDNSDPQSHAGRGWVIPNDIMSGTNDFLFTAEYIGTPIPAAWLLFGSIVAGFGFVRRKKSA